MPDLTVPHLASDGIDVDVIDTGEAYAGRITCDCGHVGEWRSGFTSADAATMARADVDPHRATGR